MNRDTGRPVVVLLGLLTALASVSVDSYLPAFPTIATDLHTSASVVQLTLTATLAGLGLGQFVVGSLSDVLGRRRPLLGGLICYVVASLLCAIAPSIAALTALRFVQGFAAAAVLVTTRATVRDLYEGHDAVRVFSMLMIVTGLGPMIAPTMGAAVLRIGSWRAIFVAMAVIAVMFAVGVVVVLDETLAHEHRRTGGLGAGARAFGDLLRNRTFIGYGLGSALTLSAMFAYVAGAPFVLEVIGGLSPQQFGLVFGVNACGLVAGSQINRLLAPRGRPRRVLLAALTSFAGAATMLLVVALTGTSRPLVLVAFFWTLLSAGFVLPTCTALALADHPRSAGSAAALLGTGQFLLGAAVAPLVGVGGTRTAVPLAVLMTGLSLGALASVGALTRSPSHVEIEILDQAPVLP